MKYAIVIPDGAADDPLAELGGRTPIEAAATPNMDAVAASGMQGLARTVPDGFESGSDVATMSLLGYDPAIYHTGRAPLEAAAKRILLSKSDWVFRCNLVTVDHGRMIDHSAGGISDAEAGALLADLAAAVSTPGFEFHQGVSYRHLLVVRGDRRFAVKTKPPHEIPGELAGPWTVHGDGAADLVAVIELSKQMFADHPVNRARIAAGRRPATQVWVWGQGHTPAMPTFVERFGLKSGCMITGVDLLRGLAVLMGWDVHEVPGMTSFHDTDYARQGADTAEMIDRCDLVLSHVESPDEASHQADVGTKVAAIEAIDRHVVGPVLAKLRTYPQWRLMVLPDHPTNIATRKHGYAPTPFAICGTGIEPGGMVYSESNAAKGARVERGHELMAMFLGNELRSS